MMNVQIIFALLFLIQAYEPASAQTPAPDPAPEEAASPWLLQRLADRAGQAKARIQSVGATVLDFAGTYYEDHIQPVAETYAEWASDIRSSLREKIQTTIDNYMPFYN